jgi:hypothetical protein
MVTATPNPIERPPHIILDSEIVLDLQHQAPMDT